MQKHTLKPTQWGPWCPALSHVTWSPSTDQTRRISWCRETTSCIKWIQAYGILTWVITLFQWFIEMGTKLSNSYNSPVSNLHGFLLHYWNPDQALLAKKVQMTHIQLSKAQSGLPGSAWTSWELQSSFSGQTVGPSAQLGPKSPCLITLLNPKSFILVLFTR